MFGDLESFQLPVPRVPPLRYVLFSASLEILYDSLRIDYISEFMATTSHGAREAREKGAQFESIMVFMHGGSCIIRAAAFKAFLKKLCANLDLEELGDFEEKDENLDRKKILTEFKKPIINKKLYEVCFSIIGTGHKKPLSV